MARQNPMRRIWSFASAVSVSVADSYLARGSVEGTMESSASAPGAGAAPLDLFPHSPVRPGQDLFLDDARRCMLNGTHLLAHAPMGLGKTAVSLAAGLEAGALHSRPLLFLTARQSQHTVAIETARMIWRRRGFGTVDLIAREDMCLAKRYGRPACLSGGRCYFLDHDTDEAVERILAYPLHVQEAVRLCLKLGVCPYRAARDASARADLIVGDYNLLFGASGTQEDNGGELVIVDEGHNVPSRVANSHGGILDIAMLRSAASSPAFRSFTEDLRALELSLRRLSVVKPKSRIEPWDLDEDLERAIGEGCAGLAGEMRKALAPLAIESHRSLLQFLENWSAFGAASLRYSEATPARLHCRLLEPGLVTAPILDRTWSTLIMSGTLHPPEMFADLLGIADRCALRRYRSPFPTENRIVLGVAGVSSRFRARGEQTFEAFARRLKEASDATPGNLACFFPSYDFMNSVVFHLRKHALSKRMMIETRDMNKNERDAMIANLRREGNAALLATLGGSFAEGIDFRDNLLSSVVIAGFPIAPPSNEGDAMRARMASKFGEKKAKAYAQTFPAVTKVLQAAGRAIRSETDRAAIILLDERYLLPSIRECMPEDFRPEGCSELITALERFFSRQRQTDEKVI